MFSEIAEQRGLEPFSPYNYSEYSRSTF